MSKVIELEQNTDAWLKWRLGGCGGSDASIIAAYFMGIDYPYDDVWAGARIYKLWCEKTGRNPLKPEKKNPKSAKEHGHRMEPVALKWWNLETEEMGKAACLEHDILPYMRASLDIYVPGVIAGEIKCPKEPQTHRQAREGQIPPRYLAQVHHNAFVAAVPVFHYVSYFEGEGVIVPFKLDPEFMDELRQAETTFWAWVTTGDFPLPLGEIESNEDTVRAAFAGYFAQEALVREAEAGLRACKLNIFRLAQQLGAKTLAGPGGIAEMAIQPRTLVKPSAGYEKAEYLKFEIKHAGDIDE